MHHGALETATERQLSRRMRTVYKDGVSVHPKKPDRTLLQGTMCPANWVLLGELRDGGYILNSSCFLSASQPFLSETSHNGICGWNK